MFSHLSKLSKLSKVALVGSAVLVPMSAHYGYKYRQALTPAILDKTRTWSKTDIIHRSHQTVDKSAWINYTVTEYRGITKIRDRVYSQYGNKIDPNKETTMREEDFSNGKIVRVKTYNTALRIHKFPTIVENFDEDGKLHGERTTYNFRDGSVITSQVYEHGVEKSHIHTDNRNGKQYDMTTPISCRNVSLKLGS